MKPYFAVIIDSFHSALSSRILWVAFAAIWIFLLGLAPIGYREDFTTTFRWFDLENGTQMKAMLARGLVDPNEETTALGRIARVFPDDLQRELRRVAKQSDIRIDKGKLADALNEALDDESWYDADAWKATVRLRELRELDEVSDDEISDAQKRRRARLRIEAALPGVFAAQSAQVITLQYLGFDFPARFAIGKDQFKTLVNKIVIPIIMNWMLGLALVFLGVLVTASMIPDMLQPGSLHLLLSKPISRTMLLMAKFVGGGAFVFLCVSQIMIGLWLIAGFRLDLWNARFLLCIPVLVLLFSVYFCVSILVGLQWRTPVLSIGITCMFGAFLIFLGFIGATFDEQVTRPDKLRSFAFAGDQMVASTVGRGPKWFDAESNKWTDLIEGIWRFDYVVPPVAIDENRIVSAKIRNGRFNLYGSGSLDLLVMDRANDFDPKPSIRLPVGTRRLFVVDDSLVALNNMGLTLTSLDSIVQTTGDEDSDEQEEDESEVSTQSLGMSAWLSELRRMQGGATEGFRSISPQGVTYSDPVRVASIAKERSFLVYSYGRLVRMKMPKKDAGPSDVCTVEADFTFEGDGAASISMAGSGNALLVSRDKEPLRWLNARSLEVMAEMDSTDLEVVTLRALGDSERFVAIATDERAYLLQLQDGQTISRERLSQKEVAGIGYDSESNRLVVGHHVDQVDFLDASGDRLRPIEDARVRATLESWRNIDRFVISPLRAVTPQTIELGDTMAALVSGESSLAYEDEVNEDQEVYRLPIMRPVLSCTAFIVAMMAISCFYFSRHDF